jgi:(S)-2-hydroxy-acid oxidase
VRKTRDGQKVEIYFDGGVRRGSDIFKALAMGANAVFYGRAVLWGLATDGQKGVELILHILNEEFKETMLITGCNSIEDIRTKGYKVIFGFI